MKRISLLLLCLFCVISLCGCSRGRSGGIAKVTGSILYIYDDTDSVYAIGTFSTHVTDEKQITLAQDKTYTLALQPSQSGGSQIMVYVGDCARFSYPEGACEIRYAADAQAEPLYELTVTAQSDFTLTVSVDGYTQSVKIIIQ